jgi:hypothetical protein
MSSSGKVAVTGVPKRKRVKAASRLGAVKEGAFLPSIHVCILLIPFFLVIGVDQTHATPVSKPAGFEATSSILNLPLDIRRHFFEASSEGIEFSDAAAMREFHMFRASNK